MQAEPTDTQSRPQQAARLTLFDLGNVILRHPKLVLGIPIILGILTAVISFVLTPQYTATASFRPEETGGNALATSGIAGLAAQLGASLPTSAGPDFYAVVLGSHNIRDALLVTPFSIAGESRPLLDILEVGGKNLDVRLERGRRRLGDVVNVNVDHQTNVVTIHVKSRYPAVAKKVADKLIELVDDFNVDKRQSNARNQRVFVQEQMEKAKKALSQREDSLKQWLSENREFQGSPQLTFEYNRLERQVQFKQDLYSSLQRQYEQARIQEVNTTPVITVVDSAVVPIKKSSPKRAKNMLVAVLIGGIIGVATAFLIEVVRSRLASNDAAALEFRGRMNGLWKGWKKR